MYLVFSVSSKPNFKNPTGSISASVGRIDSKWKSVTHQAGIFAGEDGYDIHVGNGTTLEGAVIKSEVPKAKNTLTTKSLEMKDIQNEVEYTYSNNGIGYNYYGSKKKLEEMKTNDKKGYDKIYNSIGLVPNLGVGSKGKASSTTQSAISDGILTVDGKEIDTKTINTNTENTLHQLDKIFDKKKIEERQELARLFAKNAFEEVHRLSDKYHWKEGGPEKVALHAAIGEIIAQLAGNPNGSGTVAAGINELAIKKIIDKVGKNHPDQAQILSAVLGATVNEAIDKSGNSGAAVSNYGTKWNKEYVPVEWSERAINNFADYIRDSMSEADQAKLTLELAAGTTATIAFLTVCSQKNAPEVLALVAEGTTEMIVLNAEIVGTVNEFYDVFKAAWESRTNIWERLNNYPNNNRNKIEKMKENPWDYE